MPKMRINCPNCRQPIVADIEQLFDLNANPSAKNRLLSGDINIIHCPNCGYQGSVATPLVYHDPEKELLLTFVPTEIGLRRDDQEKAIGALINQVVNKLPQEKRKGYLFRPQAALTLQGMIEQILAADGITKEMIEAQQQKLNILQRLMSATDQKAIEEIVKNEDALIDTNFFAILRRLVTAALSNGDEESARRLADLQENLLQITSVGKELLSQTKEYETAVADLKIAVEKGMTQEKLLDLVVHSPNDTRLRALVSLTRPAMDYTFFQMLSERIDRARGDGRDRLIHLREEILRLTDEIDKQVDLHIKDTQNIIAKILQSPNVEQVMDQVLPVVDEYFMKEIDRLTEEARQRGDLEKLAKLHKISEIIEKASSTPPEIQLVEELLDAENDTTRKEILTQHQDEITPEFLNIVANIAARVQESDDPELTSRINAVNRLVLRFSMERNLKKPA